MSYDRHSISGIERGVKVRFTGEGGHDDENEQANKRLAVGDVYTVRRVEVHDWSSYVWLEGYDGSFNSIFFEVASELFN